MTITASFYKITKSSLATLFAEQKQKGNTIIDLSGNGSDLSKSCKALFFPATEKVLEYKIVDKGVAEVKPDNFNDETKAVNRFIFGANICDAYALKVVGPVFGEGPVDRFFINKREATIVAAILCDNKKNACFCDQIIPRSDYSNAADLVFTEFDENSWAVRSNNNRSIDFFGNGFLHFIEDNTLKELFDKKEEKLFNSENPEEINYFPKLEALKKFIEKNFNSEIFNDASMNCIGCATCTYSCPTCHCFDIVDEKKYYNGERRKNWDSCAFSLFTLHASGHNPREYQGQRWRQRLLHKFSIYKDRFDKIACVGCGRCIRLCPAGVNMLEMFEKWKISIDHM